MSETPRVLIRTDGLIRRMSRNPANQRRRAHHRQARRPRTDCHQEQGNRRPTLRNSQGEQRNPKAPQFHARRPHQEQTPRPGNFHTRRHAVDTSWSVLRCRRSRVDHHQSARNHRSECLQVPTEYTGTSLAARRPSPCHVRRRLQLLAHRLGLQDHQP